VVNGADVTDKPSRSRRFGRNCGPKHLIEHLIERLTEHLTGPDKRSRMAR